MKTNNPELKRAYRESVAGGSQEKGGACPPPEKIWKLLAGGRSSRRRSKLMDHITSCPVCLHQFEALLEISRLEANLAQKVQSRFANEAGANRRTMVWRFATVFLIVIIVLGGALISKKWLSPARHLDERGKLSGQLRLLAPGPRPSLQVPLLFSWEAIRDSDYYILEIFDDSLLPLWKSGRLTGSVCELPGPVRARLATGKSYFWMLTAFLPDGAKKESALEEFRPID